MKRLLTIAGALALATLAVSARDIEVKTALDGKKNTAALQEKLRLKARQEAVKKFLKQLDSDIPEKMANDAASEADLFVDEDSLDVKNEHWTDLGGGTGQLEGAYIAELEVPKLISWLKENGWDSNRSYEITILEEPPSLGQMKMHRAFGNDLDGANSFIQNYTTFQRRIRDAINKKVAPVLDIKLLADNDMYDEYKTKDGTCVGAYFDVDQNEFVINRDLLNAVRDNAPQTLALIYRIDALSLETETGKIIVTVALNVKNLESGKTVSFGSQSYSLATAAKNLGGAFEDMARCAETAIDKLLNGESADERLIGLVKEICKREQPKNLKIVINANAFDAKIRKRAMYTLKKQLLEKKIAVENSIKSSNTSLTCQVVPEHKDPQDLYFEHLEPIFTEIGVELTDDMVNFDAGTVTIRAK